MTTITKATHPLQILANVQFADATRPQPNYAILKAPANVAANYALALPNNLAVGYNGYAFILNTANGNYQMDLMSLNTMAISNISTANSQLIVVANNYAQTMIESNMNLGLANLEYLTNTNNYPAFNLLSGSYNGGTLNVDPYGRVTHVANLNVQQALPNGNADYQILQYYTGNGWQIVQQPTFSSTAVSTPALTLTSVNANVNAVTSLNFSTVNVANGLSLALADASGDSNVVATAGLAVTATNLLALNAGNLTATVNNNLTLNSTNAQIHATTLLANAVNVNVNANAALLNVVGLNANVGTLTVTSANLVSFTGGNLVANFSGTSNLAVGTNSDVYAGGNLVVRTTATETSYRRANYALAFSPGGDLAMEISATRGSLTGNTAYVPLLNVAPATSGTFVISLEGCAVRDNTNVEPLQITRTVVYDSTGPTLTEQAYFDTIATSTWSTISGNTDAIGNLGSPINGNIYTVSLQNNTNAVDYTLSVRMYPVGVNLTSLPFSWR